MFFREIYKDPILNKVVADAEAQLSADELTDAIDILRERTPDLNANVPGGLLRSMHNWLEMEQAQPARYRGSEYVVRGEGARQIWHAVIEAADGEFSMPDGAMQRPTPDVRGKAISLKNSNPVPEQEWQPAPSQLANLAPSGLELDYRNILLSQETIFGLPPIASNVPEPSELSVLKDMLVDEPLPVARRNHS